MSDTEKKNESTWFQQGDVTIKPINAIPAGAAESGSKVLAEGEATGHKHVAVADDVRLFVHDGTLFMSAPNGTSVVHEEHRVIEIPPGEYQIGIVREYDHFAEVVRRVID
ncbi:MAG TPA: hypothetical protein VLL54_14600 [Pyrinomonadaceae bacterium]|nr:hypothetical protein [Pyrinomonadaceae bacterium]